jgi:hypothetical protein
VAPRRKPQVDIAPMINAGQFALRRMIVAMDALTIAISMVPAAFAHRMLRSRFAIFKESPAIEQYLLLAWVSMPMAS